MMNNNDDNIIINNNNYSNRNTVPKFCHFMLISLHDIHNVGILVIHVYEYYTFLFIFHIKWIWNVADCALKKILDIERFEIQLKKSESSLREALPFLTLYKVN